MPLCLNYSQFVKHGNIVKEDIKSILFYGFQTDWLLLC